MDFKKVEIFYQELVSSEKFNESLKDKLQRIKDEEEYKTFIQDELLPIAKTMGYDFNVDDILAYEHQKLQMLSEEELESVTGGKGLIRDAAITFISALAIAGGAYALQAMYSVQATAPAHVDTVKKVSTLSIINGDAYAKNIYDAKKAEWECGDNDVRLARFIYDAYKSGVYGIKQDVKKAEELDKHFALSEEYKTVGEGLKMLGEYAFPEMKSAQEQVMKDYHIDKNSPELVYYLYEYFRTGIGRIDSGQASQICANLTELFDPCIATDVADGWIETTKESVEFDKFISENKSKTHKELLEILDDKGEDFAKKLQYRLTDDKNLSKLLTSVDDFILRCKLQRKIENDLLTAKKSIEKIKVPEERVNHYCGITNAGNSCYFNSAIQQLYRDSDFIKYLNSMSEEKQRENWNSDQQTVYYNLIQMFCALDNAKTGSSVNVNDCVDKIRLCFSKYSFGALAYIHQAADSKELIEYIFKIIKYKNTAKIDFIPLDKVDMCKNLAAACLKKPLKTLLCFNRLAGYSKDLVGYDPKIREFDKNITVQASDSKTYEYKLIGVVKWAKGHYTSYVRLGDVWRLIDDSRCSETSTDITEAIQNIIKPGEKEAEKDNYSIKFLRYERVN